MVASPSAQRELESTRAELEASRREVAAANQLVNLLSAGEAAAAGAGAPSEELESLRVRGGIEWVEAWVQT